MLINEYFKAEKIMLHDDSWTRKTWKSNHHAWGTDTYDGCFVKHGTGKRDHQFDTYFRAAVLRAVTIFKVPEDVIRYAFTKALQNFKLIAIRGDVMEIGYVATVTNESSLEEIYQTLKEFDFYGSLQESKSGKSAQVNTPAKGKKAKSKRARCNDRRERLKAWREEYAVLPGERPKRINVSHLSKISLSMLTPEVAAGLPADMVKDFRAWCLALNGLHAGKTLDEKIDGFLSPDWKLWKKKIPEFISLHDAHIIAFRKRRAARLRKLREVAQREGQGRFRAAVLANFDGCAITGIAENLEAAHIVPDASHDYMHACNGIALVGFLHRAFDELMFSINPLTLTVFVDPVFRGWLNIHGVQLCDGNIWKLDRSALAHHWERFKDARCMDYAA